MKEDTSVHCNLCQKKLSNNEFNIHIHKNHLPKCKCYICDSSCISFAELEIHLKTDHTPTETSSQPNLYSFENLYTSGADIIRHTEETNSWIRNAFSVGTTTILSKKEMQILVRQNYNQKDVKTADEICDSCAEANVYELIVCLYCKETFTYKCHLKFHIMRHHLQLPSKLKKSLNFCTLCDMIFASEKNLLQHKEDSHQRGRNAQKSEKTSSFCHFCGKSLANRSNLKRHVLSQHTEEIGAPANQNTEFTCHHCKCVFSNKSSVKRHIQNLHLKVKDCRKSISCFQCEQRFNSIKNLNAHLTIEHAVQIVEERLKFASLNEFWEWKQDEEVRTNSRFIQLRGLRRQRRKGEEISSLKFVCNRSGIFHSKSNGKRAYRIKGSSKIGRYCSSYIEIMFKDSSSVEGTYCSTHSGHENDLRYLALTMDEKREIYEKIKSGATFSSILNEIRDTVGKEIKRKHLVTNKDLHNIVTTFKKMSKPDVQSAPDNEPPAPLSVGENISATPQDDHRNLANDFDISADLWVETCQRMVNRFDHELCKDPSGPEHDETGEPPRDQSYSMGASIPYMLNECLGQPSCYKTSQNFHCAVPENTPQMYFGTVFMPGSSGGDPCVSNFSASDRLSSEDLCLNEYSNVASNDGSSSSGNVYEKMVHPGVTDVYDFASKTEPPQPQPQPPPPPPPPLTSHTVEVECARETTTMNGAVGNESIAAVALAAAAETFKKGESDASNLRDKVNSVTTLFNIVESELDERKKNIIRGYVDSVFRVLQYRYNKSKTRKKQSSKSGTAKAVPSQRNRTNVKVLKNNSQLRRVRKSIRPNIRNHFLAAASSFPRQISN